MGKQLYESGENYLETLLLLQKKEGMARITDIACALNYSKASVSRAIGILRENGFVKSTEQGGVALTKSGEKKAKEIYERHTTLTQFLIKCLDVAEQTAEQDACRMEHVISDETFCKIKEYMELNLNEKSH